MNIGGSTKTMSLKLHFSIHKIESEEEIKKPSKMTSSVRIKKTLVKLVVEIACSWRLAMAMAMARALASVGFVECTDAALKKVVILLPEQQRCLLWVLQK